MPKFFYTIDFIIKPELTPLFEKHFAMIIQAHRVHAAGSSKMQLTRTFVGTHDAITLMIPMESLSEIEAWGHTPAIVLKHYGQEKGMEILDMYCKSMQCWESRITKPYEIETLRV